MSPPITVLCIVVLSMAGCGKSSAPPPAPQSQSNHVVTAAEYDAESEERAARAHLTLSMTDEQILRAIGVNPAEVKLCPAPQGYGGSGDFVKTAYTNETTDVEISRTSKSLLVYQAMPADRQNRWLVKPKEP